MTNPDPDLELELEREVRFQNNVIPHEFARCPPQTAPVVVIVIDTPGTDADRRVSQITDHLAAQGARPAILTDQTLQSYNPRAIHAALRGQPPPPEVDATTRWMHTRADHWAQAHRVNVIIKISANRADEAIHRLAAYQATGYRTAVSVSVAAWAVRWWEQLRRHAAARAAGLPSPPTIPTTNTNTSLTALTRHLDQDPTTAVEVLRPGHPTYRRRPGDPLPDPRRGITHLVTRTLRLHPPPAITRLIRHTLPQLRTTLTRLGITADNIRRIEKALPPTTTQRPTTPEPTSHANKTRNSRPNPGQERH